MKTLPGRILRAVIRRTRNMVENLDPVAGNFSNEAFSYAEINATPARFMSEDGQLLRPNCTWGFFRRHTWPRL